MVKRAKRFVRMLLDGFTVREAWALSKELPWAKYGAGIRVIKRGEEK